VNAGQEPNSNEVILLMMDVYGQALQVCSLWNMLPIHLRLCDSLEQFKWLLKTHLFGVWDRGPLWLFI